MTVCQRRLGLSEAEDTRLEKYSFFGRQDELVVLVAERRRRTSQQQSEYVSRCFQRGEGWTEMRGGWWKTMGLMETGAWRVC